MTEDIRSAFEFRPQQYVRIDPTGFSIEGWPSHNLTGHIAKILLIRRRFENGQLTCQSGGDVTSRNEEHCKMCHDLLCTPMLRVYLVTAGTTYILDLVPSSAQNLFALDDRLKAKGSSLHALNVQLAVLNRGHWGEVCFALAPEDF